MVREGAGKAGNLGNEKDCGILTVTQALRKWKWGGKESRGWEDKQVSERANEDRKGWVAKFEDCERCSDILWGKTGEFHAQVCNITLSQVVD
jgi:hypothetical protein